MKVYIGIFVISGIFPDIFDIFQQTYFCEFFKFSLYSVISFGSILSKSFLELIPFSESFSRNSNSNLIEPISEYSRLFFAHLSFALGWY